MQEATFNALADLALSKTGQSISPSKAYLIEARLSNILRREGFASCDDLVACLDARPNPNFEMEIAAALQTRQTWFFRDRDTLERLVSDVLPQKLKQSKAGRLKILCVGVSTGQEAYSLAILLNEHAQALSGARIDVTATDICKQSLTTARAGTYGHFEIQRGLSVHRLMRHFDQLETGQWQASEDLRLAIGFRQHNLLDADAPLGQFDLILCRHVLSSMSKSMRAKAADLLTQKLTPGGLLFLGHGETLSGSSPAFEPSRSHRGGWEVVPEARRAETRTAV
ncbi:MAG: protein-glutamate O-methyltransferase CheR [Hyphomonadaceae bacterium]|nr:protein-glutamate O-methyltransferase CheR [Hyphomonadaceae bacterium]